MVENRHVVNKPSEQTQNVMKAFTVAEHFRGRFKKYVYLYFALDVEMRVIFFISMLSRCFSDLKAVLSVLLAMVVHRFYLLI